MPLISSAICSIGFLILKSFGSGKSIGESGLVNKSGEPSDFKDLNTSDKESLGFSPNISSPACDWS